MKFFATIGGIAILAAIGAFLYFFGGFYNIAATERHLPPVFWVLEQVRLASIARHAAGTPPMSLDDPAVIQAGAKAYATRGCTFCHGGPGVEWAKFSEAMQPDPPDLNEVVKVRKPGELFFVIKNGIKMTGMPGFGQIGADDREIWSIVAFIRKLPNVSPADYKSWTEAPANP